MKDNAKGTAIEVFEGTDSFRKFLELKEDSIKEVLPRNIGLTAKKVIKMAMIAATKTPKLMLCSKLSIMQAIMASSELGLDFSGTLGEAWIIPYGNEAVFMPGYRGLIALAYRSGKVDDIEARVVYDADEFRYELGLEPKLVHIPSDESGPKKPVAFYCIAHLSNRIKKFEVMTKAEVDAVMQRSAAGRSGRSSPWTTDYSEMGRKTVTRRMMKWLPLSPDAKFALVMATEQEDQIFGLPEIEQAKILERPQEGRMSLGKRGEGKELSDSELRAKAEEAQARQEAERAATEGEAADGDTPAPGEEETGI